ncbi:CoA transferase [Streptomyces sp. NPDC021080]|uniref:CoA transferase n=1 Tax=Streptomyces sp. NPDC021080 TaxID=3365110 RepID=UPI0037BCD108
MSLGLVIPGLLGERAAYARFTRRGPWSCGGAFRILPTADGHLGLSLARPSDEELLPALIEGEVDDAWSAAGAWAAARSTREAADRVALLSLPGGAVPDPDRTSRPGIVTTVLGRRIPTARPLVVDLTSLWAGPLCAHLLGLQGARIIKAESRQRPDGARRGPAGFFRLLHDGHEQVVLDFATETDRLRELIRDADLVIESSRPRALRQLGIVAEDAVEAGTSWLSVTARGRHENAVGFGDDVAACAGLFVREGGVLLPVGDAIADPLTGVTAAVAATAALQSTEARLIDVSMLHVTAETVDDTAIPHEVVRHRGSWWAEYDKGRARIEEPRPR